VLKLSEETKIEENPFERLNEKLKPYVKERFKEPTLPQKLAIPLILDGENIMIISETGTGKTESVMLPIFSKLMEEDPKPITVLYVTPLKSLNRNLLDRLIWWANKLELDIAVRHGDTTPYQRKQQMEFPPHILIVTLETLQPLLTGKRVREHLRNVKYVILDEVHEAVSSKRGIQLAIGLERLKKLSGDFQLITLSATIGSPDKVAAFFAAGSNVKIVHAETPKQFDIQVISPKEEAEDDKIAKAIYTTKDTAARLRTIMDLIGESRSSLTFTNTREFAEILASRIKKIDANFPVDIHHGSLSKTVRISTENRFKDEEIKSIVCTSSLQLGIDIGSIDLVIQYMSPRRVSQLVQRVGRAGHGIERVSRGVVIATDEDDCFEASVIARRALAGQIEPTKFHTNSLDVLAHQLVGMTIEDWKLNVLETYNMINKAWPYSTLSYNAFMDVCRQLQRLGLVFFDTEPNVKGDKQNDTQTIGKKRRGFTYYFSNLSTIPSRKQYKIFNLLDQSFVGVLDDEFIALHGDSGTTFIVKGEPWQIIEIEDDKVIVEPSSDVEAAVPGWIGELIPVDFIVAQEVGKLRGEIAEWLDEMTENKAIEKLAKEYPIDQNTSKKMVKLIKNQKKHSKKFIPDNKSIMIEDFQNVVVIHACFGSVVNDTLGRFLAALLTTRLGSVGLKVDPYRIMIQFQPKQMNIEMIKEVLRTTAPDHLRTYIEMSVTKSDMFEWKFIHVAKRFGAFAKDVQFGRTRMKNLIGEYVGTPLYKETMREIETDKLDIEKATEILKQIQNDEIKIVHKKKGLSPIGKIGIRHKYAEIIGPERPAKELFELFKHRIMGSKTRLTCMNCGGWTQMYIIKDMPEEVKCPKCGALSLAIVPYRQNDITKVVQKKLNGKDLSADEQKMFERAEKSVELYMTYKRGAAIMLAGRGVGPHTAKKILRKYHESVEDLLNDVLKAERQFMKTKKYWKI